MHSKVIIASLVCMLAASFGNSRTMNVTKPTQFKEPKMSCCNAPNEDGINAVLYADMPYQNNDFCLFLQGLEYQSEMASHMDLLGKSPELRVYPLAYSGIYGYYYNIEQPQNDGDYYARFGVGQKEVATVYIYRSNGISYGSVLSKYDARAKYFKNQVATSSELNYYPDSWGEVKTINSTAVINAIKHYGTYVYSGTSDITMGLSTTQRSGWNDFGSNLSIKVHVEMYKNGTFYPVESARVRLFSSGTEVATGVRRTNSSGNYTFTMNFMDTFNKTLGNLQLGLFTDTAPAIIRDNNGLEYPYIYTSTSSTNLFMLKTIQYNIKIYPERSDRAAAYEIAQAELVPYKYTNYYSGTSISNARVLFPAEKTTYMTESTLHNVSASRLITIKNNHRDNWDVVNHEYGHYISDMLNLSMDPSNDIYWTHTYNEDLIHTYDFEQGRRIAYSEGLATYLGVAAQLDYATRVNPNSYCATIADEKYIDTVNGVNANFGVYRYGLSSGFYGQGVESSIPSAMIKFLDNVSRNNDDVALGHQKMWNAIRAAGSNTTDILTFDSVLVSQNPSLVNAIYAILDIEFIPHDPAPTPDTSWTIMIYMCASNLPVDRTLSQILSVENQPANANIIIEAGGGYNSNRIDRYHVRNGQLINDEYFYAQGQNSHMGDESTFEDFLFWGFENYPAQKTGVIIWNHGHGINGICADPNDIIGYDDWGEVYDQLLVSETTTAFNNAFDYFGLNKLEFIGYDACLMQVQDVADFNSDFFKYMVASEEEEVDFMWVYNEWIDNVYDGDDTETILKEIVDSFVFENDRYEYTWEQTLSVLDLSKMATYRQMFEELAQEAIDFIFNNSSLANNQVWEYYTRFIDLASFGSNQYATYLTNNEWPLYGTNDVYGFLNAIISDEVFGEPLGEIAAEIKYYLYPDKIMDPDPNVGENEAATFGPNARRTIVLYKRSSQVRLGQWRCGSHGLAMHVWSERYQTYPASETRFNKWRQLYFDYRYEIYNEAYSN